MRGTETAGKTPAAQEVAPASKMRVLVRACVLCVDVVLRLARGVADAVSAAVPSEALSHC